ncbi:hypothetical protein T05_3901 [Trichinella murrelli]|uniref:Uncharacterized protein n=1 Tax=Trichinella murrelli TaxID=144512 RepID=A0A0V0UF86_9BILA|nr:hypothetical protein T05_3901 [Trichinella murrelli]
MSKAQNRLKSSSSNANSTDRMPTLNLVLLGPTFLLLVFAYAILLDRQIFVVLVFILLGRQDYVTLIIVT